MSEPSLAMRQIQWCLPGDPFAIHLAEDLNFELNILNFIFGCFEIDNLDGDRQGSSLLIAFVDFSKRSLSDPMLSDV